MKITMIPIERLHASKTNPRKKFEGIEELAESLAEKGMLQPILVRAHGDYLKEWEVVAGERRYRASKLAQLKSVPAIVQDLSDVQALEIQLVENNQRRDVSPFEEADAIQMLMTVHGRSIDDIAARLARPAAYVRRRVLLTAVHAHYRGLWNEDMITLGGCEVLASAPRAIQEALIPRLTADQGPFPTGAIRYQVLEAGHTVARMPWDTAATYNDIRKCDGCPHRSSCQPDMFGTDEDDDRCLDQECYDAKLSAWAAVSRISIRERDKDSFGPPPGCVDKWQRITDQTIGELLGDTAKVLVKTRWGFDTYYDSEQATAALKEMGIVESAQPAADKSKEQRAAERERVKRDAAERDANIAAVVEWAAAQTWADLAKWIVPAVVRNENVDVQTAVCKRLEIPMVEAQYSPGRETLIQYAESEAVLQDQAALKRLITEVAIRPKNWGDDGPFERILNHIKEVDAAFAELRTNQGTK